MFVEKCLCCLNLENCAKVFGWTIIYVLAPFGFLLDLCSLAVSVDGEFCWTVTFLHQHHKPTSPNISEILELKKFIIDEGDSDFGICLLSAMTLFDALYCVCIWISSLLFIKGIRKVIYIIQSQIKNYKMNILEAP
jgi:hypothetical protein